MGDILLVYRIIKDKKEYECYINKQIYFNNIPIFNIQNKNSLYKLNTFVYQNKIYKHFFYFPQDAFEIAKILINNENKKGIKILEYQLNNNSVINKIGFGNYGALKRKDYLPKNKLIHISPYENSTYPVIEIRIDQAINAITTNNCFDIDAHLPIPNSLNNKEKLKQLILYKIYLEKILNDFNIVYPHGKDGLMRISEHYKNIKQLTIPDKYLKILC